MVYRNNSVTHFLSFVIQHKTVIIDIANSKMFGRLRNISIETVFLSFTNCVTLFRQSIVHGPMAESNYGRFMNALWMKSVTRDRESFMLEAKELWHSVYKGNQEAIEELVNEVAEMMRQKFSPNA